MGIVRNHECASAARGGNRDYVLAAALTGFSELAAELGGDPDALLVRQGIDPRALADAQAKQSLSAVAALLEDCAVALACPDFGMRLAMRQDGTRLWRELVPLYSIAPTLREAASFTAAHAHAYNSGIRVSIEWLAEEDCYLQRYDALSDEIAPCAQIIELLSLLTQRASISLSGGYARSHCIWFAHRRIASAQIYRRNFGVVVKFNQSCSGLLFSANAYDLRLGAEAGAFQLAAAKVSAQMPAKTIDPVRRIRAEIGARLATGCTREEIAASFGVTVRTLNRRLSSAGYSFVSLRDEVRCNLTLRHLALTDLSMTAVAAELGYADQATLTHSCRRWFGTSPLAVRRRMRAGHSLSAHRPDEWQGIDAHGHTAAPAGRAGGVKSKAGDPG